MYTQTGSKYATYHSCLTTHTVTWTHSYFLSQLFLTCSSLYLKDAHLFLFHLHWHTLSHTQTYMHTLSSLLPDFLPPCSLKAEPNQLVCRNYRAINNKGQSATAETGGGEAGVMGPLLSACAAQGLWQYHNMRFYALHCMIFTEWINLFGVLGLRRERRATNKRKCKKKKKIQTSIAAILYTMSSICLCFSHVGNRRRQAGGVYSFGVLRHPWPWAVLWCYMIRFVADCPSQSISLSLTHTHVHTQTHLYAHMHTHACARAHTHTQRDTFLQ